MDRCPEVRRTWSGRRNTTLWADPTGSSDHPRSLKRPNANSVTPIPARSAMSESVDQRMASASGCSRSPARVANYWCTSTFCQVDSRSRPKPTRQSRQPGRACARSRRRGAAIRSDSRAVPRFGRRCRLPLSVRARSAPPGLEILWGAMVLSPEAIIVTCLVPCETFDKNLWGR